MDNNIVFTRIKEIEIALKSEIETKKLRFGNLSGSATGAILFYFHLYKLTNEVKYLEYTQKLIQKCFDECQFNSLEYTYCGGVAGLFWLTNYLISHEIIDSDAYDAISDIETLLNEKVNSDLAGGFYDFLHNGLGVYYALLSAKNLKFIDKQLLIKQVTDKLMLCGLKDGDFMRWPEVNFETRLVDSTKFNLGLSHGIPSIVSVLAKSLDHCTDLITKTKIRDLAEGGAKFIESLKSGDKSNISLFPTGYITDKDPSYEPRLAWCYGDLGVALCFWHLSQAVNNDYWKQLANETINNAIINQVPHITNSIDAGFCHGTSGIAHIFRKFYWITKEKLYLDASTYWIERTYEWAKWNDGLAGYKYYFGKEGYIKKGGLLEGLIGTGLVLISSLADEEYDWDKVWLVS